MPCLAIRLSSRRVARRPDRRSPPARGAAPRRTRRTRRGDLEARRRCRTPVPRRKTRGAARAARQQVLRPLKHEVPAQMREADEVVVRVFRRRVEGPGRDIHSPGNFNKHAAGVHEASGECPPGGRAPSRVNWMRVTTASGHSDAGGRRDHLLQLHHVRDLPAHLPRCDSVSWHWAARGSLSSGGD